MINERIKYLRKLTAVIRAVSSELASMGIMLGQLDYGNNDDFEKLKPLIDIYYQIHIEEIRGRDKSDQVIIDNHSLKVGEQVYWTDPEEGICSGEYIIESINDRYISITTIPNGGVTEALASELRRI